MASGWRGARKRMRGRADDVRGTFLVARGLKRTASARIGRRKGHIKRRVWELKAFRPRIEAHHRLPGWPTSGCCEGHKICSHGPGGGRHGLRTHHARVGCVCWGRALDTAQCRIPSANEGERPDVRAAHRCRRPVPSPKRQHDGSLCIPGVRGIGRSLKKRKKRGRGEDEEYN